MEEFSLLTLEGTFDDYSSLLPCKHHHKTNMLDHSNPCAVGHTVHNCILPTENKKKLQLTVGHVKQVITDVHWLIPA